MSKTASTHRLSPYVPDLVFDWRSEAPDERHRIIDGALVFVDISGFTAMSERLASKGRVGAEELTEVINSCFSELLEVALREGGGLLKFGGDALVFFFRGPEHSARACRAALEMRARLRQIGRIRTSAGTVRLSMSVGIHAGGFHFFLAGDTYQELIIAGPGASRTVEMEAAAEAGEVLVSNELAESLEKTHLGETRADGFLLMSAPKTAVWRADSVDRGNDQEAARYLPIALRAHLASGVRQPEHRRVTIAFISFTGVDALIADEGPARAYERINALVSAVQSAAEEYEVLVLASDIAHDGGKLILLAGAPASTDSDEERMLYTARRIMDGDYGFSVRAGINQGHVYCGELGATFRRAYTVMGDPVNLAARLMAHAKPGNIVCTPEVLARSRVLWEATELKPFRVKGKAKAVSALAIGRTRGVRDRYQREQLPLFGRDREMEVLLRLFEGARTGSGALVTITGDAGIGKSRLVAELKQRAEGVVVATLLCEQYKSNTAYFPFRRLLRNLLGIGLDADSVTAGKALAREVSPLAPELLPFLPLLAIMMDADVPSTLESDAIKAQFRKPRLHETVVLLLEALLPGRALIVLEDVHWIDEASADLIRDLAAGVSGQPWLLVATARPGAPSLVSSEETPAYSIELMPLDTEAAHDLVSAAAGGDALPKHELESLARRAGGNPLFLQELAVSRALSGESALPDDIGSLIGSRIDALPAAERVLLRYAAVIGRNVPLDLLAEVIEHTDREGGWPDVGKRQTWTAASEIISYERGVIRFKHALFRDAAYEGLPYRQRRRMHGHIAGVIEKRGGVAAEEDAEILSLHYYLAQEREKAWRFSVLAGERARAKFANVEAADFFKRALEVGRGLSDVGPEDLARVAEALGDSAEVAAMYKDASRAYAAARRLVPDQASIPRLLLKDGVIRERLGQYPLALRFYSRGLRLSEKLEAKEAARERVRLGIAYAGVRYRQGRYGECARWCLRVLEDAERTKDRESIGHAYYLLALAYTFLKASDERPPYHQLALEICEELGDYVRQANVLNNIGLEAYFEGRWQEALRSYERSREARNRAGDVVGAATQVNNIGEILSDQGRLEEAGRLFSDALRTWKGAHYPVGIWLATSNLGRLAARLGDLLRAEKLLREAIAGFTEIGARTLALEAEARLAEALVLSGRSDAADELLAKVVSRARAMNGVDVVLAMLLRLSGYVALQQGVLDRAEGLLRESLEVARAASAQFEIALTLEALAHWARASGFEHDTLYAIESQKVLALLDVLITPRVPLPPTARGEALPEGIA